MRPQRKIYIFFRANVNSQTFIFCLSRYQNKIEVLVSEQFYNFHVLNDFWKILCNLLGTSFTADPVWMTSQHYIIQDIFYLLWVPFSVPWYNYVCLSSCSEWCFLIQRVFCLKATPLLKSNIGLKKITFYPWAQPGDTFSMIL